jgi:hypothetical protein
MRDAHTTRPKRGSTAHAPGGAGNVAVLNLRYLHSFRGSFDRLIILTTHSQRRGSSTARAGSQRNQLCDVFNRANAEINVLQFLDPLNRAPYKSKLILVRVGEMLRERNIYFR